mgnify:CR=1 FL=1
MYSDFSTVNRRHHSVIDGKCKLILALQIIHIIQKRFVFVDKTFVACGYYNRLDSPAPQQSLRLKSDSLSLRLDVTVLGQWRRVNRFFHALNGSCHERRQSYRRRSVFQASLRNRFGGDVAPQVGAAELCRAELEINEPLTVVNDVLIKALGEVGEAYDGGKLFLPQLISSAEAASQSFLSCS